MERASAPQPFLDRAGVRRESLGSCQRDRRGTESVEGAPVGGGDADDLREVAEVQGREEAGGAAGRHDVARTGGVVAERFRAVLADEDPAGVLDQWYGLPWVAQQQAE